MEHPPKQGLKLLPDLQFASTNVSVLMEHPPKQGLKLQEALRTGLRAGVLMEHPPKQGLKRHVAYAVHQKRCWF